MTTFSEAQLEAAFARSPQAVQQLIEDGVISSTLVQMGKQYGLHIDTIGTVTQSATHMLIGLINPTDFAVAIRAAGISEPSANGIIQQMNEQIFKPLNEQLMEAAKAAPEAPPEFPAAAPVEAVLPIAPQPLAPVPSLATPPPPPMPVTPPVPVPPVPVPPPAPIPMPAPAPIPVPPPPILPTAPQAPGTFPGMRTMAQDVAGAKQQAAAPFREIPRPVPMQQTPTAPVATPVPTAPAPSVSAQYVEPIPQPPSPPQPSMPSAEEVTSTLKQYGIDPYREPVE